MSTNKKFLGWPNCEDCGLPLTEDTAVLSVDVQAAIKYHEDYEVREQDHELEDDDWPSAPAWKWGHITCFQNFGSEYWIEGKRLTTPEAMLAATLHLQHKRWFADTYWEGAIRKIWSVGSF